MKRLWVVVLVGYDSLGAAAVIIGKRLAGTEEEAEAGFSRQTKNQQVGLMGIHVHCDVVEDEAIVAAYAEIASEIVLAEFKAPGEVSE